MRMVKVVFGGDKGKCSITIVEFYRHYNCTLYQDTVASIEIEC